MEYRDLEEFSQVADVTRAYPELEDAEYALLEIEAHPLAYDLQDELKDLFGIEDVFIKGGAIRNMISGHAVDEIDAFFDIRHSPLMDMNNMDPEEMLGYAARLINSHEGFEDCYIRFEGKINGEPMINIVGKYKGIEIDLHPVLHGVDLWTCIYDMSDAPILSTCMDPSGECWAQPEFLEHLQAGLVVPDYKKG